jgi:2-polyprenyl-3-methyl-5-hydroxy-6-metoxy-1,4-benzoquinol methylase
MASKTEQSPERLDLDEHRGDLIVSEHRGRYLWGAQLAPGLKVLDAGCGTGYGLGILEQAGASRVVGIDLSEEAVAHASQANPSERVEVLTGDLRALPFSDGEFDLVVCFEVIEHVDDREAILLELARVLGPRGLLCISTPNSRVYPPGNPYHVHEYEPEELAEALGAHFSEVTLYRQTAWLASAILSDTETEAWGSGEAFTPRTVKTEPRSPGEETFTVAVAGQGEVPVAPSVVAMGEPFEVRWWETQLNNVIIESRELDRERERERREQGQAMLHIETELAETYEKIAQLQITQAEVKEWAAEQVGERDKAEYERRDFETRLRRAEATIGDITGSLSWRITAPVRAAKRLFSGA